MVSLNILSLIMSHHFATFSVVLRSQLLFEPGSAVLVQLIYLFLLDAPRSHSHVAATNPKGPST